MKQGTKIATGLVVVAAIAAGGGYLAGQRAGTAHDSPVATSAGAAAKEKKVLYYRNPMGLPDTSPVPKKDPMGMDYIPVFEGEEESEPASANQLRISTEKVQKLGVRTEAASLRVIDKAVRAAGRVEPDERRTFVIAPKFEGYVERLHVNATGQPVAKGQPLFEVYSPELVSAQREYAIAVQGVQALRNAEGAEGAGQSGMKQLADSALARLKNWDISDEQIRALAKSGEARRTLTFRSPAGGIVTEKKAVQGMRFMPGETLYQVADLSTVWVFADVFEQDIGFVRSGAKAKVKINAYPDREFEGKVTYVYPTLNADTRTAQVRVELPNAGMALKPGMFANVELAAVAGKSVVTVPNSAVIDSGTRRVVLVKANEGRFEPREVRLGTRGEEYVEVLEGVREGEEVVVAANFLIDAESNLKAAVGAFGSKDKGGAASASNAGTGHRAAGTVDSIDVSTGTVSIEHGPVPSLKWPGMTMEFKLANESLVKSLKPGASIDFTFVERQPGEWVITEVKPAASTPTQGKAPAAGHAHSGN